MLIVNFQEKNFSESHPAPPAPLAPYPRHPFSPLYIPHMQMVTRVLLYIHICNSQF